MGKPKCHFQNILYSFCSGFIWHS